MTVVVSGVDRKPQFANLVTHPGFSDQLCYGDVTLRFMYAWSEMSKHDRERILRESHGLESPEISAEQKQSHNASKTAAQCVQIVELLVALIMLL